MVDHLPIVCCMCGDVGFPEKLFRCSKCLSRYQHSYCSNYCNDLTEITTCDWCHSEQRNVRHGVHSKRSAVVVGKEGGVLSRSESSGDKMKQNDGEESSDKGKSSTGNAPSPRPSGRRYKLLKDVLC